MLLFNKMNVIKKSRKLLYLRYKKGECNNLYLNKRYSGRTFCPSAKDPCGVGEGSSRPFCPPDLLLLSQPIDDGLAFLHNLLV